MVLGTQKGAGGDDIRGVREELESEVEEMCESKDLKRKERQWEETMGESGYSTK